LNAKSQYSNSEDDGTAEHRINQYVIKQEIGRGSFGSVHLAVDQFGCEYVCCSGYDDVMAVVLTINIGSQGVLKIEVEEEGAIKHAQKNQCRQTWLHQRTSYSKWFQFTSSPAGDWLASSGGPKLIGTDSSRDCHYEKAGPSKRRELDRSSG